MSDFEGGPNGAEAGVAFLEANKDKEGVVTLASGLQYKVLEEGTGLKHPLVDSPCDCHYAGTLLDGTQFDSSYSRGKPSTFAPNQVIKGWTEAMQLMVVGDKWEMYIPYALAYGANGKPPKIPAKATLIFIMEIVRIKGGSHPVTEFPKWTEEDLELWTAKDQTACDVWRDAKIAKWDAGDEKLKTKYAVRTALDNFVDGQCDTTKNQALWKRTRAKRRDAKNGAPPPLVPPEASGPPQLTATTGRVLLTEVIDAFKVPANRERLESAVARIDALPGDESTKALQKMMQLMPIVSDIAEPALKAQGFKKEDLMTVTSQMQALGAEDPTITVDTKKLMDAATQGKIAPLLA